MAIKNGEFTLRHVLRTASTFPSDARLYLPLDEVWTLDTRCAIVESSTLDCEAAPQEVHDSTTFAPALQLGQLQEVVHNATSQLATASDQQLLDALLFYCDHDAFISF